MRNKKGQFIKGYKQSEEEKEVRRKRMIGNTISRGLKMTDEAKNKISNALSGKRKTLEDAENCEELWNINNGRTLCKSCHIKRHKIK